MNQKTPVVFVSYSHDSTDHKRWVARLSATLRENGVDVILDQWDLGLGDDIAVFMESGLRRSDRVLVICTDEYNRKADAGIGGVGYEKMIVTADLIRDISTNKFIPLIRNVSGATKTPACLSTRTYIDFTDIHENELNASNINVTKLLSELHDIPSQSKPALGKIPFAVLPLGEESKKIDVKIQIETEEKNAKQLYDLAVDLARVGDQLGWRQLVKKVKIPVIEGLHRWRNKYEAKPPATIDELHAAVDEAVQVVSGLVAIALAGIESGREGFNDQRSLFDLLFDIAGWKYAGRTVLIHLPRALGYTYHSLYGAMCINTGQYEKALQLATMMVQDPLHSYTSPLWQDHSLMGWSDTLGGNCIQAWQFLINACKRWDWLTPIFDSEFDYKVSLISYYAALNIFELAEYLSQQPTITIDPEAMTSAVPLCFLNEKNDEVRKAMNLITSHGRKPRILWESLGVKKQAMLDAWPEWQKVSRRWLRDVYRNHIFLVEGVPLPNDNIIRNIS